MPELTKSEAVELHDGGGDRSAMPDFTAKLIQQGQAKGYRFITVDQLVPSSTVSHGHTAADTLGYALLWLQGSLLTQLAGSPDGTGAILDRLAAEYSSGHQQLLVQDRTLGATSARPAGSARRPVWPDTEHVADTERNVSSQTTFGGLHSPRRRAGE